MKYACVLLNKGSIEDVARVQLRIFGECLGASIGDSRLCLPHF